MWFFFVLLGRSEFLTGIKVITGGWLVYKLKQTG
jgi:hypothetical protein